MVGDGINLAVGRLNKTVLIDAGIGRQRADQADVGAFRRLNGADAAVMAVVNVAHFHAGAVTVESTGAQGRKAALVRQFSQGIGLIHELAQLGGTEKFLDRGGHRADVDQVARLDVIGVLDGHALTHHALQTGHADADLVLQQFAHAAQAAVAQMVDIVDNAHAIGKAQQVADGSDDVIDDDVLGHQQRGILADQAKQILLLRAFDQAQQGGEVHHLQNAGLLGIKGQVVFSVREVVSDNLVHAVGYADIDGIDAGVLNGEGLLPADRVTGLHQHFAGGAVNDILSGDMVGNAGGDAQFFIVLIAAHAHQVIALGIKEQAVKQCARAFFRRRLARLLPAVDLKQRVGL